MTPQALSDEALEDLAQRALEADARVTLARYSGEPQASGRALDLRPIEKAYAATRPADPARGVLFAESLVSSASLKPTAFLARAALEQPVRLRGESNSIPWNAVQAASIGETSAPRRAAIEHAADAVALELVAPAREVFEAWRDVAHRLGYANARELHAACGRGSDAHAGAAATAVLAATEDVYRESDAWIRRRRGLPRTGNLAWSDRQGSLATPNASERMSVADRTGIASRWIERLGMGDLLRKIRDESLPPAVYATGQRALCLRPGQCAVIAGTPMRGADGVVDLVGTVAGALPCTLSAEVFPSQRAGVDRLCRHVSTALGRSLALDGGFLVREAGVDRGQTAVVLLDLLHREVLRLRWSAAMARFVREASAHASNLAARFVEQATHAVGAAPDPVWAVHEAVRALEDAPDAQCIGAVLASSLRRDLRETCNEDWFRNPRAGTILRTRMNAMLATGTVAAFQATPSDEFPPGVLAQSLTESWRDATR